MEVTAVMWEGWGQVLAFIGMGIMVGASGAGSAVGFGLVGGATLGLLKKRPEAFGQALTLCAIPSSQGIYGFVGFILYSAKVSAITAGGAMLSLTSGAVVLGAGTAMALSCGISAIHQSRIGANGITAIASGYNAFGTTLILAVFPELYAILSLVAAILIMPLVV